MKDVPSAAFTSTGPACDRRTSPFGAVTFRAWLAVFGIAGLPFQQTYAVGAWSSWLIDLLAAEALIAGLPAARRQAGRQAAMPSSNAPAGES